MKRIGFAGSDGSPTDIYKRFRGSSGGAALAEGIRQAYSELYEHNEYMHECNEQDLRDLIVQVSGMEADARPVGLIYSTLKGLIEAAEFEDEVELESEEEARSSEELNNFGAKSHHVNIPMVAHQNQETVGLNIGYTINLNLPETTNIEVFNAICKSLKEHLLRSGDV